VLLLKRSSTLQPAIAAIYNLNTNNFRYFPMTDSPFCSGHIRLKDETVLVVGGDNVGLDRGFADGRFNVRKFVPGYTPFYNITDRMRPYFSATVDPDSGARWYPR